MVAVGKPGEFIPPIGAFRIYANNENWHSVVAEIISGSQIVIVRPGPTAGLTWELKFVFSNIEPCRIIIFVPPSDRFKNYAKFRSELSEEFSIDLPQNLGSSCFVRFANDGETTILSSSRLGKLRSLAQASRAPEFHSALKPVATSLGIKYGHIPPTRFEFGAIFCAFLIVNVASSLVTSL